MFTLRCSNLISDMNQMMRMEMSEANSKVFHFCITIDIQSGNRKPVRSTIIVWKADISFRTFLLAYDASPTHDIQYGWPEKKLEILLSQYLNQ